MPLCASQFVWANDISGLRNVSATADANIVPATETSAAHPVQTVSMSADLSTKTDTELTALTAQWGNLNPGQRRQLLAEVRGRMVANQKIRRRSSGVLVRRYGRVVRKSDGSVVVETRVVQMTPRSSTRSATGSLKGEIRTRVTFGIGFEQRSKTRPQPNESVQAPAVTVSQQQSQSAEP